MGDFSAFPFQRTAKALLLIGAFILFYLLTTQSPADFIIHCTFIKTLSEKGIFFPYLYFLVVQTLTLASTNLQSIIIATSGLLALSLWAKLELTQKYLSEGTANGVGFRAVLWAAFALLFVFTLPFGPGVWYRGQFPPNIWHNSTTIAVMPFCLLLFFQTYKYAIEKAFSSKLWWQVFLNASVLTAIKPSFMFCAAFAFPLFMLLEKQSLKNWLFGCMAFGGAAAVLGLQYWYIYVLKINTLFSEYGDSSVAFGFFTVWKHSSTNIPYSLLITFLLPAAYFVAYPAIRLDKYYRFALLHLLFGLMFAIFVYEEGQRVLHGNFMIQLNICNYILHLVSVRLFLQSRKKKILCHTKDQILAVLLGLHILAGIVYIGRMVFRHSYW